MVRSISRVFAFAGLCSLSLAQQPTPVVGTNINMVSGTVWPTGDPFLQRQNEPSMAISSRNPLHMLAGANDYRTVDIPAAPGAIEPTGDAWLGLFKSFDGGRTWISNLVPGYPQDQTQQGLSSPLKGLQAGADPGVRAGTNGMFYYSGLAFNRAANGASEIFVARFIDDNNVEGADTIRYLGTSVVQYSNPARTQPPSGTTFFEDKPSIAVDLPRSGAGNCTVAGPSTPGGLLPSRETFPAGNIYVAWTQFIGSETSEMSSILFSVSHDCGITWSAPLTLSGATLTNQGAIIAVDPNNGTVYVAWRVFSTLGKDPDEIAYVASTNYGASFSPPVVVSKINPFDQGTTGLSFRSNDYPALTVDNNSRVYIAWSQRCPGMAACSGDNTSKTARIVLVAGSPFPQSCSDADPSSSPPSLAAAGNIAWSSPVQVDDFNGPGHQFIPALAFSSGKLTAAWYDQRDDDYLFVYTPEAAAQYITSLMSDGGLPMYPDFGPYIVDPSVEEIEEANGLARRQTIDVRSAQMIPPCSGLLAFGPSVQVSAYFFGSFPTESKIQQLQFNPPNLPMFASGLEPFFGDYIDIAGPSFIPNHDGTWRYNNRSTDPDFTHVVWTDNRNVIQPGDGNWANYVPPTYNSSTTSLFDPSMTRPSCTASNSNQTGDRNQDIYTARLSPGIAVSPRTNFKQLGYIPGSTTLIERQFPIVVENDGSTTNFYQLTIVSPQPPGGSASFVQFAAANIAYLTIPPDSSASQSVFVKSTDPHAEVQIAVVQVSQPNGGGTVIPNGQQGSATINGDISNPNIANPNIANPNIANPNIANPNIANAEVYNPNIANPNIANPNIANPNIANPNIANPNIANITVANPNIANPNIANPNIANPNIANPNIANPNIANEDLADGVITDATWTVTNYGNTASSYNVNVNTQHPPNQVFTQLVVSQYYSTPVASGCALTVVSHFVPVSNTVSPNGGVTPTVALQPGESALVTYRAFDFTTTDPKVALTHYNPIVGLVKVVSQGVNTNLPSTSPPASSTPPIDITNKVYISKSPLSATYSGFISVINVTNETLPGPIYLLLNGLPANVTVSSAGLPMGISPAGPYFLVSTGSIPPAPYGHVRFSIQFSDPSNVPIIYTGKVYSGTAP